MAQLIGSFAGISNFRWERVNVHLRANGRLGPRQPEKSRTLEMGKKCSSSIISMPFFFSWLYSWATFPRSFAVNLGHLTKVCLIEYGWKWCLPLPGLDHRKLFCTTFSLYCSLGSLWHFKTKGLWVPGSPVIHSSLLPTPHPALWLMLDCSTIQR